MPSLHAVQAAIQAQVETAITGAQAYFGNPPALVTINAKVGIGWPSVQMLQANVKGANAVVSVYDRKLAKDTTRWRPIILSDVVTATGIANIVSGNNIAPAGSATITLTGTPVNNDAISAVIRNPTIPFAPSGGGNLLLEGGDGILELEGGGAFELEAGTAGWTNTWAVVVSAGPSDTIVTIAAALAAAINADPLLSQWVSASATGPVVTVTSLLTRGTLVLNSYVGNNGLRTTEVARRSRMMQIVVWTPTEEIRQAVGDPIETLIAGLQNNFGIQFPDGTFGRVAYGSDFYLEDDTLQDTYRRDFLFSVEYGITQQDQLYSVLAPIVQYQIN